MNPPETLDITGTVPGFTIETNYHGDSTCTLWRPIGVLKGKSPIGTLQEYKEDGFYQNNNDVTKSKYKVKGYRYPVIAWFDNETQERIA